MSLLNPTMSVLFPKLGYIAPGVKAWLGSYDGVSLFHYPIKVSQINFKLVGVDFVQVTI